MVFALAVGGSVMAANIYGDQDHSPPDDVQQIVKDHFDPAETAQLKALRESDFVMETEIHSHSYRLSQSVSSSLYKRNPIIPIKTTRSVPHSVTYLNSICVRQIQCHMPFNNLGWSYDNATMK
jgi:hypothetical protein